MPIVRLDHVQLAMPRGGEDRAREFYSGLLRIPEVAKPAPLAGRGGAWFESGDLKVHLGVDPEFRASRKAHPAFLVRGLAELVTRLRSAGVEIVSGEGEAAEERVYATDPFGNRLELIASDD